MIRTFSFILAAFATLTLTPAVAQNGGQFAARMMINDQAITNYEVDQRKQFLTLLRAPGNVDELALEGLIEDRLRLDAAAEAGIVLSPEDVQAGMEEFAGRAQLALPEFIQAIKAAGVSEETFRDFVTAGLSWRNLVQQRFGPRTIITESEIDRAIAQSGTQSSARVLLTELILPANTPDAKARSERLAATLSQNIKTEAAFASAVRKYSVSPSRARGGRVDWVPIGNLPPQIATAVLSLAPGEVTDPFPVTNAIVLFQLRDLEERSVPSEQTLAVEYAQFFVANTENASSQLAQIKSRVDNCDDLYGVAKGLPEERLVRETKPLSDIANDIGFELAKLDENEVSTALSRGSNRMLLMLCGRTVQVDEETDREQIRRSLGNQRLASYGTGYLEELRADAIIREP